MPCYIFISTSHKKFTAMKIIANTSIHCLKTKQKQKHQINKHREEKKVLLIFNYFLFKFEHYPTCL